MITSSFHIRASFFAYIFAGSLSLSTAAFAAEINWKAAFASVKITPDVPVAMSGYANRVKPFERVEQDIYAKALALEDQEGHRAVILTMDLIGLSASVAEPVCKRITEKTGIERDRILLNYAHNHAGPAPSLTARPGLGVTPQDAQNTIEYTIALQTKLVNLAAEAVSKLQPATLSWGVGVANFVMNRREFTPTGVILGVEPRGPADRAVPVLRVENADHKLVGVLFGCACHNTTLGGDNYAICGDYAGFAEHGIQEKLPGVVAMFMIGCGGDANPYPRGTMDQARQHGRELAEEVCRVLNLPKDDPAKNTAAFTQKLKTVGGPLKTAFDHADIPLQSPPKELLVKLAEKSPSWQIGNAKTMLGMLEKGQALPTTYRAPMEVWQFGDDLTIVGISGEVVVDYAVFVEKALGPMKLWPAGYCNDYFGYLPSARVISEGGYENRGLSNGTGWFSPQAQKVVIAKIKELAQKVGRKLPSE